MSSVLISNTVTIDRYNPHEVKVLGALNFSFWNQFSSVTQSCPTLCYPMDCSTPGFPVHHPLPELTQTHDHHVGDAIQPCHPLSSPSPPTFNLSQHQGIFQRVGSSHQVAKVLEFQLQHSVLLNIQNWFPLGLTDWISLQSKGLSRVFSNTTVQIIILNNFQEFKGVLRLKVLRTTLDSILLGKFQFNLSKERTTKKHFLYQKDFKDQWDKDDNLNIPIWASLVAQMVKHLPAMQETWVLTLGQEDPLEKKMATHSSTLAWKIPWTEEPGRLQSMWSQRVGHDWATLLTFIWGAGFPSVSLVKNPPAMQEPQETWVQSLGHVEPLEEEMATVFLPGKIPRTEEPGGLQSMGVTNSWIWLSTHTYIQHCLVNTHHCWEEYFNLIYMKYEVNCISRL